MNKKNSVILLICIISVLLALTGCYEPVVYPELVTSSSVPSMTLYSQSPSSSVSSRTRYSQLPSSSASSRTSYSQLPSSSVSSRTLYPQSPSSTLSRPSTLFVPGQYRIVGRSVQRLPIMSFVFGQGQDVTFIIAAMHGNEPAGVPLVRRLVKYLQKQPQIMEGRRIVLLTVANPDGMAHRSRFNANGVDLNRNFPSANRVNDRQSGATPLSEPEARVIKQLIEQYSPDRIVSLHQPLSCIDYDGPGENLAVRMFIYCNLPVKKLGARPGSLGSYAGVDLGIPIITLEMRQNDSTLDSNTLWNRYGRALVAAIVYPERVP
jgi:protein MpaA